MHYARAFPREAVGDGHARRPHCDETTYYSYPCLTYSVVTFDKHISECEGLARTRARRMRTGLKLESALCAMDVMCTRQVTTAARAPAFNG